jgi:hypothetical protein
VDIEAGLCNPSSKKKLLGSTKFGIESTHRMDLNCKMLEGNQRIYDDEFEKLATKMQKPNDFEEWSRAETFCYPLSLFS